MSVITIAPEEKNVNTMKEPSIIGAISELSEIS